MYTINYQLLPISGIISTKTKHYVHKLVSLDNKMEEKPALMGVYLFVRCL